MHIEEVDVGTDRGKQIWVAADGFVEVTEYDEFFMIALTLSEFCLEIADEL